MFTSVTDRSQVAEARRLVSNQARAIGLTAERIDQIAIVVTELATNLIKHGGGGHIHSRRYDDADGAGLEVLALDRGRGMTDIRRCMQDGYSTAGSPGNGLGAIERLAGDLRVYSKPGHGTAIMARFHQRPGIRQGSQLGAVLAPYPGEEVCGDNWAFHQAVSGPTLLLADGAGHGVEAARAAETAVNAFVRNAEASCEEIVTALHAALAPTRGAAVAVARIDATAGLAHFVGVGNISALLVQAGGTRHMVSHNGTAGHVAPRIRAFTYEFAATPMVILYSDGLATRWDITAYPGLVSQHPALVAGVLLRDHRRGRDDSSVVVMRNLP